MWDGSKAVQQMIYTTSEPPIKYDIVFLGVDFGKEDMTKYVRYQDGKFIEISEEEYKELVNGQ